MSLGSKLYECRKKALLSQEVVADEIGVARQTVSKWELDEAIPNIYQVKELAVLYQVGLDDLVETDVIMTEIKQVLERTTDKNMDQVNWTKVWSKKYPILDAYLEEVDVSFYAEQLKELLSSLEDKYQYSRLDAMLVLKDILAKEWKKNNKE